MLTALRSHFSTPGPADLPIPSDVPGVIDDIGNLPDAEGEKPDQYGEHNRRQHEDQHQRGEAALKLQFFLKKGDERLQEGSQRDRDDERGKHVPGHRDDPNHGENDEQKTNKPKGKTLSGFPLFCHFSHRPGPG